MLIQRFALAIAKAVEVYAQEERAMLIARGALAIAQAVEVYLRRVGIKDPNLTSGMPFMSGPGICQPSHH